MKGVVSTTLVGVLLSLGVAPGAGAAVYAGADADPVIVSLDQVALHTTIGQRIQVVSTVLNDTDGVLSGLVAHFDVLSVDPGVYVDPEDWSSQRTVYLGPLGAHQAIRVPWKVHVVNDGRFVVFASVTTQAGAARVDASDGLRLTATAQHSVSTGSVLPLVLGLPTFLLALILVAGLRRRRLR